MASSFGKTIEKLMHQKRVSARSLAKEIGVPYRTVQEWVGAGGRRMPRDPEILKKLSNFFDISVHYILYGCEDSKGSTIEFLSQAEIPSGIYQISLKKIGPRKR